LRADHATVADVLLRVREVACSSDKIVEFAWRSPFSEALKRAEEINMLWTIFVVLLILWVLGFSLHIAGGLIHLLLVVALVVLVINLLSGRGAVV
jgi:hypothetical protein